MRWKYKVIKLSKEATASGKHLTALGAQGWELVAVVTNENRYLAYLRMADETPSYTVKL